MNSAGDILRGRRQAWHQAQLKTVEWRAFTQRMKAAKGGRCEVCRREQGLQTHHNFYDDRLLWEYEADEVRLLCDGCHKEFEEALRSFRRYVSSQLTPSQFRVLNGALAVGLREHDRNALLGAVVELVRANNKLTNLEWATRSHNAKHAKIKESPWISLKPPQEPKLAICPQDTSPVVS